MILEHVLLTRSLYNAAVLTTTIVCRPSRSQQRVVFTPDLLIRAPAARSTPACPKAANWAGIIWVLSPTASLPTLPSSPGSSVVIGTGIALISIAVSQLLTGNWGLSLTQPVSIWTHSANM